MSSILLGLRRMRDDRAPAIGLALLILVTATLFGIAPRLVDQVGDDALRGVVANAQPFDRNIALLEEEVLPPDPTEPLKLIDEEGDQLDTRIPASIRAIVRERLTIVDSARFHVEAPTPDPTFIRFRIQPGAEERIRYVSGVAPTATHEQIDLPADLRRLLPPEEAGAEAPLAVGVLEGSVSSEGAKALGNGVGDLVFLSLDGRDPLSRRQRGVVAIRISGIYEVSDPDDPFWYHDQSLNHVGVRTLGGDSRLFDVGVFLPAAAYETLVSGTPPFGIPARTTWRHFVDPSRLTAAGLGAVLADLRRLETTFPQTQVTTASLTGAGMRSGLLPLLTTHAQRWASASAVLTVVAIGPAAVAFAALALVATIAARRRRPALALVRGRGGTLGQLIRAVFLEGCVVAIPALGLAIALSVWLIPAGSAQATILTASAVATVAIGLLIVTALPGTTAAVRAARGTDPIPRGVTARRLVLDALVIVLAVGGAWLLRERGVRGASSTGALAGADPLIAAVPALAGLAAGLTAIRLVPLPLRLLGRIAARGRGLVPLLAFRRASVGGTSAPVLVVLLAAASIGVFSTTALVHLDRAAAAASWHQVGAPIQIASQGGPLPAGFDPRTVPGVRASALLYQISTSVGPRNLRITFVAVDIDAYLRILAGSPADPGIPPEMLGSTVPNGVVPIIVSPSLAARSDGVPLGTAFSLLADGDHYQVQPIATRATFPTLPFDGTFAIASRQQLNVLNPKAPLAPSVVFLDASDDDLGAIQAAVDAVTLSATVQSRTAVARAFSDSPVTKAIIVGIAIASLVAAAYAALAVTAALALAGAARSSEVAHLRMIGLSRGDALGLALIEHGPTVFLAFIVGVALGLGLFVLLEPSLGIDAIVGSTVEVPLSLDPQQLAIIGGGVFAIAALGIGLAAWMQRRGGAVAALARGLEA
ncbi:MAG TPA: ABC transporter permease [Candidatus Limnocylindrales bacterium]